MEQLESKMNKEELKQQYDKLVSGIETAKMFDGRNKGVDVYVCKKCGKQFYTRYIDKGVTPFTIKCRHCEHGTMKHDQTISERVANFMALEVHNWVRPTYEQTLKLNESTQKLHVSDVFIVFFLIWILVYSTVECAIIVGDIMVTIRIVKNLLIQEINLSFFLWFFNFIQCCK